MNLKWQQRGFQFQIGNRKSSFCGAVIIKSGAFCVCVDVNQNGIAGFEAIIPVVTRTGQHFCTYC